MNQINPKKLLNSKWTSTSPKNKEKHFMVIEVNVDEEDNVVSCVLEAVLTKRATTIEWQVLQDEKNWAHGWQ